MHCSKKNPDIHFIRASFSLYDNEVQKFEKYIKQLDELYVKEIDVLSKETSTEKLPQHLRMQLSNEYTNLLTKVNLGFREDRESILKEEDFEKLVEDFKRDCPLLSDVVATLFPLDGTEYARRRELSITHALSLLMSLKNPYAKNDIKLLFSVLLIPLVLAAD